MVIRPEFGRTAEIHNEVPRDHAGRRPIFPHGPSWVGEGGDTTEVYGGVEDIPGRGLGRRIKPYAQQMGRIHQTGAWMLVLPSPVNGAELGAQEWRE